MVPVGVKSCGALTVVVFNYALLAVTDLLVHKFAGAPLAKRVVLVIDDVVGASTFVSHRVDSYRVGNPWVVLSHIFIVFGRRHHLVVNLLEGTLLGWGLKRHVVSGVAREGFVLDAQLLSV